MKLIKRKTKSVTPITIAIPAHQKEQLKKPPRISFAAFKENKATATDWFNITFRIKVGLLVAISVYTQETESEMRVSLNTCLAIKEHYHTTDTWSATEKQLELIEMALDATDTMQDETTRRVQLDAYHTSQIYMNKLIKK